MDKIINKNLPIIIFEQNENDLIKSCSHVMNHLVKKKIYFMKLMQKFLIQNLYLRKFYCP